MPQGRVFKHALFIKSRPFPKFPISQKTPAHLARYGKLGNWEMARGTYFPISQKTPAQMGQHGLGIWEIGKWLEVHMGIYRYLFMLYPQPDVVPNTDDRLRLPKNMLDQRES